MAKTRKESVLSSNVREWHVKRALESVTALAEVADELTEDEALFCLDLETKTRRRKSIVDVLMRLAVKLRRRAYIEHLETHYHAAYPVTDSE